jgi:hypothetical protein
MDFDKKWLSKEFEVVSFFNLGNNLLLIEKENYFRMFGKYINLCKLRTFDLPKKMKVSDNNYLINLRGLWKIIVTLRKINDEKIKEKRNNIIFELISLQRRRVNYGKR